MLTSLQSIAKDYVSKWQTYATASSGDHLTLQYGQDDTWGLSYNLYGDKLLGLGLFPDSIYEMRAYELDVLSAGLLTGAVETAWYNKVKGAHQSFPE